MALVVKNLPANAGDIRDMGSTPGSGSLEEGMATHSSILAWIISWTEDPGGLVHRDMTEATLHTCIYVYIFKQAAFR